MASHEKFPSRAKPKEELVPVHDTELSVAYLGVELPKATDSENAPKKEQYADYINDRFSLELQKKIATSWKQGDPILIESGTSIGKTTTVKKMCADLGWEVHYVNLNGATDVEDFMGRYIPNHERKSPDDPEYVFSDGKITSGLRQEEGKKKVILLDEYNSAAPNILIRLHEVLDALERNSEVVLAEDASEKIQVNKDATKVIGLMNPPGRGYLQREPLDPAQIRRWVYVKEASELPDESLTHATRALFHLEDKTEKVEDSVYLFANEAALTPEQFKEIPGIETILTKYLEFHKGAKELLASRRIAKDQPQRFLFDDREEPKRVRDFISAFYRGDINATTQEALRYYYANKLLEPEDKEALEELIRTVEYVPPQNTKRRTLDDIEQFGQEGAPETWDKVAEFEDKLAAKISDLEKELGVPSSEARDGLELSLADAERILGKESVLGAKDVEQVFGIKLDRAPAIPFSQEELQRAKELGQQLILQVDTMLHKASGLMSREKSVPLTLESLKQKFTKSHDDKKVFYEQDWYKDEDFFKKEKPRVGWRLTSRDLLPESTSKSYLEQTDVLVEHLQKQVFKGTKLPKQYEDAIAEFKRKRAESGTDSEWKRGSQMLADLAITKLARELPVEAMYRFILNDQAHKDKPLPSTYTWTASRTSGGSLVFVGNFDAEGTRVDGNEPRYSHSLLGVSFSRS
ncbi:MAG: hypothetical protein B7X04_00095 [Parcubacteria group bacterium 21-54-25]|nr:MAG: hypothetical protein B7X04_00095 [Parcubacteria group bacterium 21-54-25]HQU07541.1 AAA family ATPase [Candidatus Paceibacterota bacterium]